MTDRELIEEQYGTDWRCGEDKRSGQTFCTECYFALPRTERLPASRANSSSGSPRTVR